MTDRDGLDLPEDAAAIRDEQVGRALERLDARGELTPHERATVERLTDRLTVGLLQMFDGERAPETVTGDSEDGPALFSD